MTKKRNILLVQPNYQYGANVFLPYSAGMIQAYAETIPEIRESFRFLEPVFLRKNPKEVVKSLVEPAVVGFSNYIWNWEYNKTLAKLIREAFPECLVVFGGTQTPDRSEGFFVEHPYADILVHHEGEFTFADILCTSLESHPDYTSVPGISVRLGTSAFKTKPGNRIRDLSLLPSPYLSGVFDFLLEKPFALNVSQETNRGCPYSCTFCDWGGSTFDKVFVFPEERILEEFDWFGRHKAAYLFNCDANYGIMPRDLELTEKMIRVREKNGGYPDKFRMCTAKNSGERIFSITKMLSDAGMNKGATLSFQSLDPHTLKLVRRSNIKLETFADLMRRYKAAGIATYTELIMGMPGETYESTKRGIDVLIEGQDDAVNIYAYVCTMLPNSEMSRTEYVEAHKIKSVRMPILLAHSTPVGDSLAEYQDVIVETASMSMADWQRIYLFYWAVQAFHCLGLLRHVAIVFRKHLDMPYSEFYEQLIEFFGADDVTLLGKEIRAVKKLVAGAVGGGRLDVVLPHFGEICWPLEEASFLTFVSKKETFYREVKDFLRSLSERSDTLMEEDLLDDLIRYQSAVLRDPYNAEASLELRYDLHGYLRRLEEPESTLSRTSSKLTIKAEKSYGGDLERYAREVVWYGRKGGQFHHTNVAVEYADI